MKKYIAPEVEIKRFAVENIMTDSSADAVVSDAATVGTLANDKVATVDYSTIFTLN